MYQKIVKKINSNPKIKITFISLSILINIHCYSIGFKTNQGGIIPLEKNINGVYSVAPLQEQLFDTIQQTRIIKDEEKNNHFIKENNLEPNPQEWMEHFHECYKLTTIINGEKDSIIIFNIPYREKIYPIEYKYHCLSEYDNFEKKDLRIYSGPSANAAIIITELQKATQEDITKNNKIAITGDLVFNGASNNVGDVYAKTIAAIKNNIDYLFVPGFGESFETNYAEALRAITDYKKNKRNKSKLQIIEYFSIYDLVKGLEQLEPKKENQKEALINMREKLVKLNKELDIPNPKTKFLKK